jgi:hypothetical protein
MDAPGEQDICESGPMRSFPDVHSRQSSGDRSVVCEIKLNHRRVRWAGIAVSREGWRILENRQFPSKVCVPFNLLTLTLKRNSSVAQLWFAWIYLESNHRQKGMELLRMSANQGNAEPQILLERYTIWKLLNWDEIEKSWKERKVLFAWIRWADMAFFSSGRWEIQILPLFFGLHGIQFSELGVSLMQTSPTQLQSFMNPIVNTPAN